MMSSPGTHAPWDLAPAAPQPRVQTLRAAEPWVEPYALGVFALTFLYVIFGIPGTDNTDSSVTDRVSPLNSWIWLGLLALSFPILTSRWRQVLDLAKGSWVLLLLLGYFTASTLWALDSGSSMRRVLFTYVQMIEIGILLCGVRRPQMVHVVIATICCVCAFADLVAYVAAPGATMTDEGFAGLQGQKNQTGLLMMYGYLSSMMAIFLTRNRILQATLFVSSLVMVGLLIMTRSSTSESVVFGATALIPILLLIARLPGGMIRAVAALFVGTLVASLFGYLVWCGITGADPMLPLRGMTFTARTDIWSFEIDEIWKRPWFGVGYSSFWAIDPAVQPSLKSDQWFGVYAIISEGHNGYIDQLATGGIFGLLGSLFVVFRTIGLAGRAVNWAQTVPAAWRPGMMTYPTAVFYLAFLLGFLLHNFTESSLFANNGPLAVALLICILDLEKWRITCEATGRTIGRKQRAIMVGVPTRR